MIILLFADTASALPTTAHGTVRGEMYVSSTANWDSKLSTNNFNVPNGTVVFARYYVGVWGSTDTLSSISTTFNGHAFETNPSYYSSSMGVTWIPYDVTSYLQPGEKNTATINSAKWGDGRQYGTTLVVVLKNESKPQMEYWIADGLDWLHYGDYVGSEVNNSFTYFNGTVDLADVQSASLYSTHLTGYNYEDFNGASLSNPADSVSGGYFDYIRWDNVKDSLVAENQTVNVGRGDDTYCSPVFHALSIEYKASDLKPVNLSPSIVTANISTIMTATIENRGSKDSQPFNVSLMVKGKVVDTQSVPGLAAGGNTMVDLHWTPDGSADTYSLNVVVDPENTVVESNEDNNILTSLIGANSATAPVADFSADKTSGDAPLTVTFTDQSTKSPISWAWDFDNDGTIDSTEQNPTYIYSTPGNYTVNLTVSNAGGTNSSLKMNYITVSAITPIANFTASPLTGGTPLTVNFSDQSTNTPTEWFWDFGDGTNASTQNPSHTYAAAGKYTINLTVSNVAGSDSEVKTDYISALVPPVANFTATPTTGSAPLLVTFKDQSINMPTSWLWDFGDGSNSTSQNPTHLYTAIGTYTVKLTATNIAGNNTTSKIGYITISTASGPVWTSKSEWNVALIGTRTVPCLVDLDDDGDYDLLNGIHTGEVFGYENTGTKNSPVWIQKSAWNTPDIGSYAAPCFSDLDNDGDYDLLIGDKSGKAYGYENTGTKNSPSWTKNTAWDTPDIGSYAAPCLVDLDNDGDYDLLIGDKSGVTYAYENTGTKNSPVWAQKSVWNTPDIGDYATPCFSDLDEDGDYDLLIGNIDGISYAYENTGTKNSPVWTQKSAWNTPNIGACATPFFADLDNDGDYDLLIGSNAGNIYGYENTASLVGSKPDLTLTAVTPQSSIVTNTPCTISSTINNTGTGNAGAFNATLSVNDTVVDTQSVSGIASGSSSTVNFTWTPTVAGDYNLTVTADPGNGIFESDETNNALTVVVTASSGSTAPVANFTADVTNGTAPLTVNFTDQSTGSPTSWLWDFGDGANSTDQNVSHTYTAAGNYTVNLTVANTEGNDSEVKTDYIVVSEPFPGAPVANFTATPTSGNVPLTVNFTDQSIGSPTSWLWNFGDGTNATDQNVSHTYTSAGNYTVNLTVSNAAGNNTITKTGYITVILVATSGPTWTAKSEWNAPDIGYYASPCLPDLDGDGDYDLLIGEVNGNLRAYENTGTISNPVWTRNTAWDTKISSNPCPCSADLDGDGDYDLLVGIGSGYLRTYENLGTTSSPKWTRNTAWEVTDDLGTNAAPCLADLDGDGDYDLLAGSASNFRAYENTGTISSPVWTRKTTWETTSYNYAHPSLADLDGDRDNDLLIGTVSGDVYAYENTGTVSNPVWTRNTAWDAPDISSSSSDCSAPCLADFDSDGDYDLLIGGFDGSTYAYENTAISAVAKPDLTPTEIVPSSGITANTPFTISSTINNTGTGNAGAFNATLSVNDTVVDTQSVSGIASGSSSTVNFTWTPTVAGDYNLTVTADPGNGISESDETNNALTVLVTASSASITPVANFTADVTNGTVPLTVNFMDQSTGSPTSWFWDFGDNSTATEQNPLHIYSKVGNYTVNLTVANAGGNNSIIKTNYITVLQSATNDLSISGIVNTVPGSAVFAKEPNTIKVLNIMNTGTASLTNISVALYASDISNGTVPVNTTTIASLAGGAKTTVSLIDPTIRNLEGGTVTYTAVVDPDNLIPETNEANNNKSSSAKPLRYNGYKGKGIYWEGGSNITTKHTYDLQGNLLYSTQPDTSYKAVGWTGRTETWTANDLSIPSGSTIEKVFLYFAYNWDQTTGGYPWLNLNFNGNTIENGNLSTGNGTLYRDWSNFGGYADYEYGLCVYDVTDKFNEAGNSLVTNPYGSSYNKVALYPSTLVVIYRNSSETRKQIFINEECDELGVSESSYGTTPEEATAYAPFTGMSIDKSNVTNATMYSFAGSAGPDEGNLLFNGNTVAPLAWKGSSNSASPLIFNATSYISETRNEAGIQGTTSGGMDALQQILVVDYQKEQQAAPVANFTASVTNGTAPLTVQFTDASTGNVSSYAWDFDNDGTVDSTEQSPSYTYAKAGVYTVNLTVINANGSDSEVKTDYITVSNSSTPIEPEPVAAFISDVTSGTTPLTVNFTDQSTGSPISWLWDFGDGNNSTEQNVSHTYTSAGNYTVNLTVANADGSDSEVKTEYIVVSEPLPGAPVANFTANRTSGKAPLDVQFTDASTGNISSYAWDFDNDGTVDSTEQSPLYTYASAGTYTVNLTVTGSDGNDSEVKTGYIKVSSPSSAKPVAAFSASPTSGKTPLNVKFTDTSTGSPTSWKWDFGDGSKSYLQNPTHKYSKAGTYTVSLTVKNAKGSNTVTKTEYIKVITKPVANFSANPTSGKTPLKVTFTDTSTGIPAKWIWDFGDGSKSYLQNPIHKYSKAGTYTVNLTVKNAKGKNTVTKTEYIKVITKPVANFTSSATSGKAPLKVTFTDTSAGSPTLWKWDFGDGSKSFLQNPIHKYSKAGTYTVNLTVKNAKGSNTATKTEYIKVI